MPDLGEAVFEITTPEEAHALVQSVMLAVGIDPYEPTVTNSDVMMPITYVLSCLIAAAPTDAMMRSCREQVVDLLYQMTDDLQGKTSFVTRPMKKDLQ